MGRVYLVTGAAGHLGRVITRQLVESGQRVQAMVLPGEANTPPDAEIVFGNVCDPSSLQPVFDNLAGEELVVIHCAGIVSIASTFDQTVFDVNVTGTQNIVDLCEQHQVAKLVYVSSVHAIPEEPKGETMTEISEFRPELVHGLYAKTKAAATAYVLAAANRGLTVCVVHPSGITGPEDHGRGHLTTLVTDFYTGRLTAGIVGGYDFVDVRDVATGIISVCDKGQAGECYILSNRFFTVEELLDTLHDVTGKKRVKVFLPVWFIKTVAPLAELHYKRLNQPPLFTAYSVYTLSSNGLFSHAKATAELGYEPRDMRETLQDTVEWLKAEGRI